MSIQEQVDSAPADIGADPAGWSRIDPGHALTQLYGEAVRTPVRRLPWLERIAGVPVYAKLEHQQHTGSFKYRSAYLAMTRQPGRPVIAASAGNHGLAVAEVARRTGRTVNICVPTVASRLKRERIIATGAGLIEHGNSVDDATSYARALAVERDLHYIAPYNDPDVIAGSSTIAVELLEEVPDLATLVAPIGGGGLICGLAIGARYAGSPARIVGCEPSRYGAATASLLAGAITRVLHQPTFADGLAVNLEADSITFPLMRRLVDETVLLSEEDLAAATLALLVHESILVEPAGAAAVIACLRLAERGALHGPVGIPLCGGNIAHATLARIQQFAYTDPSLLRLLDLRGRAVGDVPVWFERPTVPTSPEQNDVTTSAATPGDELIPQLRNCAEKLSAAHAQLREFGEYCGANALTAGASPVVADLTAATERARRLLSADAGTVASTEDGIPADHLLRYGLATLSYARGALEWCSPSYAQSRMPQFFDLGSQDAPTVNYERYEHAPARTVEEQLQRVLALPTDRFALSVTSSGMAAYTLVEAFLLRRVLAPGDTVLVAPYIYFEAAEQLNALPFVKVMRAQGYDVESLLSAFSEHWPRCVFVDPLANTAEQRMIDVDGFVSQLRDLAREPVTVVIDGTMISGALRPDTLRSDELVQVIYYESCSKYMQLGLDAGMAGLVAYPVERRAEFERLRRNTGTILYRHQATQFPSFDRTYFRHRMARLTENAVAVVEALGRNRRVDDACEVWFPGHPSHPDAEIGRTYPYLGGCVTFSFRESGRNHRDLLDSLIDRMLAEARRIELPLTKGVSFGFSVPRICAASSMAETEPPFLRLFVGNRGEADVQRLADVVGRAIVSGS